MTSTVHDIRTLVVSRICHDLVSPLGAISNGLEMLSLTLGNDSEEMRLAGQAVKSASNRLRLFRIAFGTADEKTIVPETEIRAAIDAVAYDGKFRISWSSEGPYRQDAMRLIFLAIMCLQSSMPRGGKIEVSELGGNWAIAGVSEHRFVEHDGWSVFSRPPSTQTFSPSDIHFAVLKPALDSSGHDLVLDQSEDRIRIILERTGPA